jgi:stearoyl-CoA desaturase (delta-9 desaturase)
VDARASITDLSVYAPPRAVRHRVDWLGTTAFAAVHVAAVAGVVAIGWSARGAWLAAALFYLRFFGVSAGSHRYFAHRAFKTSRAAQLVLALLATTSTQNGVLWWAAVHRAHHRTSDTARDIHSKTQHGFFWAHMGWMLTRSYDATDFAEVKDFARYPELRWLNRWHLVPTFGLAIGLFAVGGAHALVWGFLVSTVLVWHVTLGLNSFAHWIGTRRYATGDDSRNNPLFALLALGEGWHNNHHHCPSSAAQGFAWWEIDPTYYALRALEAVGLVWDVRRPPATLERVAPSRSAP